MSSDLTSIQSQFNLNSDNSNSESVYEFEKFRLDAVNLMLYENETAVSLAPKVIETLLALVERSGEIVSKKEMMNRLWADSFVEDANLTQNIYLLRKTLGKGADGRDFVETLRRRGYRFTGEVKRTKLSDSKAAEQSHLTNNAAQTALLEKPSARFSLRYAVAALCVLLIAVFGLTMFYRREKGGAAQTPRTGNVSLKRLTPNLTTFNPVISPNGEFVAYAKLEEKGMNSLRLRNMQTGEERELLPPVTKGYMGLQFSPDGREIYYLTNKKNAPRDVLARINIETGATREIVENIFVWFAVSPDGERVAFVRDADLIVADTNGDRNERKISTRDGKSKWFSSQTAQPAWSPDGKRIVVSGGYLEQGAKRSELIEISASDGAEKRIETPPWEKIGSVAWTEGGAALYVIAREEPNQPMQIFYLTFENGAARKITSDLHNYNSLSLTADSRFLVAEQSAGKSDVWIAEKNNLKQIKQITFDDEENTGVNGLAFMPDGRIVYTSPRSGNIDLWMMNADGSNQKQLTSNLSGWNIRPRPTPDGRYIVFQSFYENQNRIWRMDADGKNVIQLTSGGTAESSPDISPDGQWVYYASASDERVSIWKVSINGGEQVRVSADDKCSAPSVSPDGKLIAVHYEWDQKASSKIGVISAETGNLLKTFDAAVFRRILKWSPDSKSLIFIQRNSPNLWQQPIDGGEPRQITDFNLEQTWNFAVSPDDQRIAVVRGSINTEAVLINNFN